MAMCPYCQTMFRDLDELREEAKDEKGHSTVNFIFAAFFTIAIVLSRIIINLFPFGEILLSFLSIVYILLIILVIYMIVSGIISATKSKKLNAEIENLVNQMAFQAMLKSDDSSNS